MVGVRLLRLNIPKWLLLAIMALGACDSACGLSSSI